jgi:hypothetical protein
MSAQYLKDKAREISYALVRVSFYIKRPDLKSRLESLSFELLENSAKAGVDDSLENLNRALANISALDGLIRLGYSIYEIEPVNANILVKELDGLNSAIRQFGKMDEELPNLENLFSDRPNEPEAGSQNANSRYVNLEELENLDSNDVGDSAKNKNGNGNGLNTAIRQSEIINRIKLGNGNGCRLKDLIAEFPDVSERTLRYDLQKLCDLGVIERIGNGGPASYYSYKGAPVPQVSN